MLSRSSDATPPVQMPVQAPALTPLSFLDLTALPPDALSLWLRSPPDSLVRWLDDLPVEKLPAGRLLISPDQAELAARVLAGDRDDPDAPERALLIKDIVALIRLFARLAACPHVDVRLDCVTGNACWRFHRDAVPLRMVTTWRGPGTEYVDQDHAAEALSRQQSYAGPFSRFPRFAVGLFRGGPDGAVHRSPPIVGSGIARLLLCLSTPSNASPPLWDAGSPPTGDCPGLL
jgi:hypothetical protein